MLIYNTYDNDDNSYDDSPGYLDDCYFAWDDMDSFIRLMMYIEEMNSIC